jgi:DNA-binding PadR family transcriptional regulator
VQGDTRPFSYPACQPRFVEQRLGLGTMITNGQVAATLCREAVTPVFAESKSFRRMCFGKRCAGAMSRRTEAHFPQPLQRLGTGKMPFGVPVSDGVCRRYAPSSISARTSNGVPIVDEIARRTGREVAPAAVYVTLRRLEEKGMLASWMGESTGKRGGKARRYVRVTRAGLESLRASRQALDRMWRGLDIDLRGAR